MNVVSAVEKVNQKHGVIVMVVNLIVMENVEEKLKKTHVENAAAQD